MKSESIAFTVRLKLYAILGIVTGLAYFLTQWFPVFQPTTLPLTRLDHLVPFSPAWSWIYQTVYFVTPLVALNIRKRRTFAEYFHGYLIMLALCTVAFILYPVTAPRPDWNVVPMEDFMHQLILTYDGEINCFPSLHVGMAVFSAIHFLQMISLRGLSGLFLCAGSVVWVLLLCYSTLALKQHYFVDIPAGIFTAIFAYFFSRFSYRLWTGKI